MRVTHLFCADEKQTNKLLVKVLEYKESIEYK